MAQGKPPDCVGGIPTTQSWGFCLHVGLLRVSVREPRPGSLTSLPLKQMLQCGPGSGDVSVAQGGRRFVQQR